MCSSDLSPFVAEQHFSLLALLRCEIQAIDQHWSLRRVAVSLSDGAPDDSLARAFELVPIASGGGSEPAWPTPDPARWREFLGAALRDDLADDLAAIRYRQAQHLARELGRVDDYFEHYEQELVARSARTGSEATTLKWCRCRYTWRTVGTGVLHGCRATIASLHRFLSHVHPKQHKCAEG